MFVNAVKMAPRFVMSLTLAVALSLAVLLMATVSVLGFTLALQGWATSSSSTTTHVPGRQ